MLLLHWPAMWHAAVLWGRPPVQHTAADRAACLTDATVLQLLRAPAPHYIVADIAAISSASGPELGETIMLPRDYYSTNHDGRLNAALARDQSANRHAAYEVTQT